MKRLAILSVLMLACLGARPALHRYCISIEQPDGSIDTWRLVTAEPVQAIPTPAHAKEIKRAIRSSAEHRKSPELLLASTSVRFHTEISWGRDIPRRRKPGDRGGPTPPSGYDCVGGAARYDGKSRFVGCDVGAFSGCYVCTAR